MRCFFIEPLEKTRSKLFRGPSATPITERLYVCKENGHVRWEEDHIPGYNFGPGAMFYETIWEEKCLMLMFKQGQYINIDGHVSTCKWLLKPKSMNAKELIAGPVHKCRTRVGVPPMITVTHHCEAPSMIWTLENGIFEANDGNRNTIVQIPSGAKA